jgi:hypothetical protein
MVPVKSGNNLVKLAFAGSRRASLENKLNPSPVENTPENSGVGG